MHQIDPAALHALLEHAPDGVFVHDEQGRMLAVNARWCADTGYTRAEWLGMRITAVAAGARWAEATPGRAATPTQTNTQTDTQTITRKDGSAFPVEIRRSCLAIDGRPLVLGIARGTSARAPLEQAQHAHQIQQQHGRLALAARVGGLGVWDYDLVHDVLECDAQWYRIMGRDPQQPVRTVAEFRTMVHPEDVARATEIDLTAARLVASGQDYGIEFRIVRPDGALRWVRSAACLLDDLAGVPQRAVGFVVDITETRLAAERLQQAMEALSRQSVELERRSLEDPLTGIANRRCLDHELERARLQGVRARQPLALALIDIDFFKRYNDRYGHLQGDEALKAVARTLAAGVRRPSDLVARYGGEEFAVLLPASDQPEDVLRKIAADLAVLKLPHATSPIAPHLTISCGCVVASRLDALSALDLLAHSDRALYRAKSEGRNRIVTTRL
ncbi:GGDEF domain-containing protein [Pseudorhodoferax sp.]|uniref:GGDEF domain-containing protein n=1 Tax=Pseudorhodoferax sp. TaxID=1993553 RepID=UPI002DD68F26|nr:diguanylate cyclase [Pseudorhodoferax sp.]